MTKVHQPLGAIAMNPSNTSHSGRRVPAWRPPSPTLRSPSRTSSKSPAEKELSREVSGASQNGALARSAFCKPTCTWILPSFTAQSAAELAERAEPWEAPKAVEPNGSPAKSIGKQDLNPLDLLMMGIDIPGPVKASRSVEVRLPRKAPLVRTHRNTRIQRTVSSDKRVVQSPPKLESPEIKFVIFDSHQPCSPESERLATYIQEQRDPGLSPADRWARLEQFQRPMPKDFWQKITRATGGVMGITPKWFAQWKDGLGRDIESLSQEMAKCDQRSRGVKQNNVDALATKANAIIDRLYLLSAYLGDQKPSVRGQLRDLIATMESSLKLITHNPPF